MDNSNIKRLRFILLLFISMIGCGVLARGSDFDGSPRAGARGEDAARRTSKIRYRVVDPKKLPPLVGKGPARVQIRIQTRGQAKVVKAAFESSPVKGGDASPEARKGRETRAAKPSLRAHGVSAKTEDSPGSAKIVATLQAEGSFVVLGAYVSSALAEDPRPRALVDVLYTTPTLVGISAQPSGGRMMIVTTVATEQLAKIRDTSVTVNPEEIVLAFKVERPPRFMGVSLSVGQIGPEQEGSAKDPGKVAEPRVLVSAKGNMEPVAVIQNSTESILALLVNSNMEDPSVRKETREKIREILLEAIGIEDVAALTLGMYRKTKFSSAEFTEFVDVFSKILFSTYISHLEDYTSEKVHITEVKEMKTRPGSTPKAQVLTQIVSKSKETPMNYSLFKRDGKWLVYDIKIEGVSLVVNYRSQFKEILRRDSGRDLLKRMEKKVLENEKN